MLKAKRHAKIFEIIKTCDIETQEELVSLLAKAGFEVTQATVSRDIREMMLTKVVTDDGKQKYSALEAREHDESGRMNRIFKDGVVSMDYAQNILVVKTLPGFAMGVGSAFDAMKDTDIIGSVCGDDTILCVMRTESDALAMLERLREKLD